MIVQQEQIDGAASGGGRLVVVTQSDHAHFAAELLSLWRTDGLPEHPRRQELLLAVREHDNGWREADSAPRVEPETGRPYDFISLPRPLHREIWWRGIERHAEQHPAVALLIVHHALLLSRKRAQREAPGPDEEEFIAGLEERHGELLEAAGRGHEEVAADYRFLGLSDHLSLVVTAGWREPFEHSGVRGRLEPARPTSGDAEVGARLLLDPFPFAGTTTFRIAARRIADQQYASDSDLALALATARWSEVSVQVAPLS